MKITLPGGRETDDELRVVEEIVLEGEAFAQLSVLYVIVHIRARLRQSCRRCLVPVTTTLELDEAFEVPIPPSTDTVDVRPEALKLVLSAHDPNVLCRPGCRGLCPVCGTDLNRHPDHDCGAADERRTLGELISWTEDS